MTRLLTALLAALLIATPATASAPEKKKGGGSTFIAIPPTAANVVRPNGRMGIVTVETSLDVKDEALRARAEASTPRLRAAYATALQSHARGLGAGAPPNPDRLARELQRATDQVLGKPGAKLLLGSIILN